MKENARNQAWTDPNILNRTTCFALNINKNRLTNCFDFIFEFGLNATLSRFVQPTMRIEKRKKRNTAMESHPK